MTKVTEGSTVSIHFIGKRSDGTIFETTNGSRPLTFRVGDGAVIRGLEMAVLDMEIGQTKTVTIPADLGYGPKRPAALIDLPIEMVPENANLVVGESLRVRLKSGKVARVTLAKVEGTQVTIDTNHPLAGRDLTYMIKVIDVQ